MSDTTEETEVTSDTTAAETFASEAGWYGVRIGFWLGMMCFYIAILVSGMSTEFYMTAALATGIAITALLMVIHAFEFIGWLAGSCIDAMKGSEETEEDPEES